VLEVVGVHGDAGNGDGVAGLPEYSTTESEVWMRSHILAKIDLDKWRLERDVAALADIPKIQEEYDEFASGFWKNVSLWNSSGRADDSMYKDLPGVATPTPHNEHVPYLDEVVRSVFDTRIVKMVRARNLVDGMVVPHRDFVELDKDSDQYLRTFMVLEDNHQSFHADGNTVMRMRPGEVWFLDAASIHSAVNFSTESRQSLCVDFAFDGDFHESDIFADKDVYNPDIEPEIVPREPFTDQHRDDLIGLARLIDTANFKDILFLLSKIHYRHDVHPAYTYDWLSDICQESGDPALRDKAREIQHYMIGQRDLGERFAVATAETVTV
jgi:hypothetical protein